MSPPLVPFITTQRCLRENNLKIDTDERFESWGRSVKVETAAVLSVYHESNHDFLSMKGMNKATRSIERRLRLVDTLSSLMDREQYESLGDSERNQVQESFLNTEDTIDVNLESNLNITAVTAKSQNSDYIDDDESAMWRDDLSSGIDVVAEKYFDLLDLEEWGCDEIRKEYICFGMMRRAVRRSSLIAVRTSIDSQGEYETFVPVTEKTACSSPFFDAFNRLLARTLSLFAHSLFAH